MKKLIVLSAISLLFNIYAWAQEEVSDSIGGAPEELLVPAVNPNIQCEDTCSHIHGIDMSHYQGNVFWQTIGDDTNMAYVYLKATEGGVLSFLSSIG